MPTEEAKPPVISVPLSFEDFYQKKFSKEPPNMEEYKRTKDIKKTIYDINSLLGVMEELKPKIIPFIAYKAVQGFAMDIKLFEDAAKIDLQLLQKML